MINWMKEKFRYGSLIPAYIFFSMFIIGGIMLFLLQDNRKVLAVEFGETIKVDSNSNINTEEEGIEWTSSNVNIATVSSDGIVQGISPGETEISLKIDDDTIEKYRVVVFSYNDEDKGKKYINVDKITLDITEKDLYIGEQLHLVAAISPSDATNQTIIWESNNQDIAVVDQNGNVSAISEGTVEIIAKSINDIEAKTTINVRKKAEVIRTPKPSKEISSISIRQGKEKTLKVGASLNLSLIFKPSNSATSDITWTSSNNKIVTVDKNGKISAKKVGNATITAKTKNNLSAKINIIVKEIVTPELNIELDSDTIQIGNKIQIVSQNNTGSIITYESSNPKIASIDKNGKLTAHRSGKVKITIKSDNVERYAEINVVGSRIHFINIGVAGDAILLESNGKFAMVDTGGSSQSATIKNYLKNFGISKLDFVILSHPHTDHAGGIVDLMNGGIKINTIYTKRYNFNDIAAVNNSTSTKTRINNIISTANKYDTNVIYVDQSINDGSTITLNNMKIYFFNTMQRLETKGTNQSFNYYSSNYWAGKSENVNSIVNLIRVNNHNALLTADLNQYDILNAIINKVNGIISGKKLDVYKIAHHGYHNCTGNKPLTVRADKYIVTNSIDDRAGDGSYQISNTPVSNGNSCFMNMNLNMCSAYYANNSTNGIIVDFTNSKVNLSGGGLGKYSSSRCN